MRLLLLLTACSGSRPEPSSRGLTDGFETGLSRTGGCSDAVLYASNDGDTIGLIFRTRAVAEGTLTAGEQKTFSYDFSEEGATLEVWTGENVTAYTCATEIEQVRKVERSLFAISGAATLITTPDGEEVEAELSIAEALLEDSEGDQVEMGRFLMTATIGWEP